MKDLGKTPFSCAFSVAGTQTHPVMLNENHQVSSNLNPEGIILPSYMGIIRIPINQSV